MALGFYVERTELSILVASESVGEHCADFFWYEFFFLGFSKSYSKDAKSWHKDLENYSFNKIVLDFWMPDLLVWAVFSLTLVPSCVRDWTQYFTYVPGPVWANSIYFIHYFHTNCWCSECTLGSALKDHPWQFSGTVCDAGDWTQAHQGK